MKGCGAAKENGVSLGVVGWGGWMVIDDFGRGPQILNLRTQGTASKKETEENAQNTTKGSSFVPQSLGGGGRSSLNLGAERFGGYFQGARQNCGNN